MNAHKNKHLTLSDRIYIESELCRGSTFKYIANFLGKDQSTISKEVRSHRELIPFAQNISKCKKCTKYKTCEEKNVCRNPFCRHLCKKCHNYNVPLFCSRYSEQECSRIKKPPYVCNSCKSFNTCLLEKACYVAVKAQKQYEEKLTYSRQGINMTTAELKELNDLISPLVLKGQPLSHIFAVHADEIPVCRRTLYNYFDQNIFKAKSIDLPRKVRYKKRKKRHHQPQKYNQQLYRNNRTYADFERFVKDFPDLDIVEMDTVKGKRSSGKCLLTLLFRSCNFMIVILLPNCTQKSVIEAINSICDSIGLNTFRKFFPIILTDNGPEFKDPWDIEKNEKGQKRTMIFYCDPYVSNQKARLEKNHEYIRYVIPKGRSMEKYTQEDISLMASHINSTARDSLNGSSPFDLANLLLDKKIPALTGQFKVSPDDVMLKPALIEHRD